LSTAIPDHPKPRGLAGAILLEKVCGYYAEKGMPLSELKQIAERVMASISTIGISITSCSLPHSANLNRIETGHSELGLGVHGEPEVEVLATQNVQEILKIMTDRLKIKRSGPIAVLLNNLGGVSEFEMGIIPATLLKIDGLDIKILVGPAGLGTSLDMKGFSITFLELAGNNFGEALLNKINVHGWVQPIEIHPGLEKSGGGVCPIGELKS